MRCVQRLQEHFDNLSYQSHARSEIEKSRGNVDEAIRLLESVRGYDFGDFTGSANVYSRGHLHLEKRRGNEAAAEFKKIIENPGVSWFSPVHALGHLGRPVPPSSMATQQVRERRIRTSSRFGRTPTQTCRCWFKPARNMTTEILNTDVIYFPA